MRKILCSIMALMLIMSMLSTSLASSGDITIIRNSGDDDMTITPNIRTALLNGRDVYIFMDNDLLVYNIDDGSKTTYDNSRVYSDYGEDGSDGADDEADGDDAEPEEPDLSETIRWRENLGMFLMDGELYAVTVYHNNSDDASTVDGAYINHVVFKDDATELEATDYPQLDLSNILETYGDYESVRYIEKLCAAGNSLFVQTYDDGGNNVINVFDLSDGSCRELYIEDLMSFCVVDEKTLVVEQFNWSTPDTLTMAYYDIEEDTFAESCTVEVDDYMYLTVFCYDAANDKLYYIYNGEIWAADRLDLDNAQSVNDSPLEANQCNAQLTDDGYMLLYDWNTVLLKSTDPSKRSSFALSVMSYTSYSWERAYYAYTEAHGDIDVTIREGRDPEEILQAMLNHDTTYDIYSMTISASEYDALYRRGYLREIEGSDYIAERVDAMWPVFAEAVKKDGAIVCVPLNASGTCLGYNTSVLEKAGLDASQLPTTWDGFLDFLQTLPEQMQDNEEVRPFDQWIEQREVKVLLKIQILTDYQNQMSMQGVTDYAFNTPELVSLLDRVDEIDFEALEVSEQIWDDEAGESLVEYDGREALFDMHASIVDMDDFASRTRPLLLSIGGEKPVAGVDLEVAFVNPYTEHYDEAIDFLATVMDSSSLETKYYLYPEYDEPLHYSDYEEYKANIVVWRDDAIKSREEADDDEKAGWDETIEYYNETIEHIEDSYWRISPHRIEAYREYVDSLMVITYDFMNQLGDSDSELTDIFMQYFDGETMSTEEFLGALDKKVSMMRQEGY